MSYYRRVVGGGGFEPGAVLAGWLLMRNREVFRPGHLPEPKVIHEAGPSEGDKD